MKIKINNNVGVMSDPSFKFFLKKNRDLEEKCLSLLSNFTSKTR
jgi:hypothetical protein